METKELIEITTPAFTREEKGKGKEIVEKEATVENDEELSLVHFENLRLAIIDSNQSLDSNIDLLKKKTAASLIIHTDQSKLERMVSVFIKRELDKTGLFLQIELASEKFEKLLGEIKFFGKTSSYLTGFFSHEFSFEDRERWEKIEEILDSIYNAEYGLLNQVQNHFLFNISKKEISKMLGLEELSLVEELFIRSILVKGYLVNLRQLISPFYGISDDMLINFKKERILQLKEAKNDLNREEKEKEIALLENQVEKLRLQIESSEQDLKKSENKFQITADSITIYNTQLNTRSVVLGTVETARYVTSAIGHKINNDFLKSAGNLFFRSTSKVARFIPFVSTAVEVYSQTKNNEIVYNYEKRLKTLEVIEKVKRNLFVAEQRVTDYYIDNILHRLQQSLLEDRGLTNQLITTVYDNHVLSRREQNLEQNFELLKKEIFQHVNAARNAIARKHLSVVNEKNQELLDKDSELVSLGAELLDSREKNSEQELEFKRSSHEITRLNARNSTLQKNVELLQEENRSLLKSIETKEKALGEAIDGTFSGDVKSLMIKQTERTAYLESTVSVLTNRNNQLALQIESLNSDLKFKSDLSVDEIDTLQGSIESLKFQLDNKKKEIESLKKSCQSFRDQNSTLELDLIALQASLEISNKSIDDEIIKCNNYRARIDDLEKKLVGYDPEEIHKLKRENQVLESCNNALEADITKKEAEINTRKKLLTDRETKITALKETVRRESRKKKVLTAGSWIRYGCSRLEKLSIISQKTLDNIDTSITAITSLYVIKDIDNYSYEAAFMGFGILTYLLLKRLRRWWKGQPTSINNTYINYPPQDISSLLESQTFQKSTVKKKTKSPQRITKKKKLSD